MKKYYFFFLAAVLFVSIDAVAQFQKINKSENARPVAKPEPVNKQTSVIKNTVLTNPVYDFSNVKICVDQHSVANNLPPRINSAGEPIHKINSDGSLSTTGVIRQPLAAETMKMWDVGQIITVFLSTNNGSAAIREKVMFYARQWETIANIRFDFNGSFKTAQIKIQFDNDNRNWSLIGKDVLFNPLGFYTMHYGSIDGSTEESIKGLVLHEFGHALGFIHEHQSPAGGIQWDKEKVYAFFGGPPNNWSRGEVDLYLFKKYSVTTTNYSTYDRNSIMHYSFPASLTTNGIGSSQNNDFSSTDRSYARQLYPFPITPANATGILRTGDDCDLVNFVVEYDAVPADKIEFIIELGQYSNKTVTWWKQIGIPKTNNTETFLWVQNHSLIASENRTTLAMQIPFNEIDINRGISFWKAKFLGVHTLLNYKWNVLPAVRGGCKITLSWNKDTCL